MATLTVIVPATDRPASLPACLMAIGAADTPPEQVISVTEADRPGPAAARNAGAREATGDVLVFVDSDVIVHPDAFVRIRAAFERPELMALFGSYDDSPGDDGEVSAFRNLLHYHVHQQARGRAETFWAGLGAVRREVFERVGGFDERYREPSIEDIELGTRLHEEEALIELDPDVQGTHLKTWSVESMVETDLLRRGAPWIELMLEQGRPSTALNLGWSHRLSTLCSLGIAASVLKRRPLMATASLAGLIALNRDFYELLLRKRGPEGAAAGVGLHIVHHLTAAASLPLGAYRFVAKQLAEAEAEPDATPSAPEQES